MAGDFSLVVELDDRAALEKLKAFPSQAGKAGADAGKALNESFSKAAAQTTAGANMLKEVERAAARFPNVISSQLTRAASSASTPATQLGTLVAKGIQGGADRIPAVIAAALASATSKAGAAGQQLGTAIGTGAQAPLSKLLNSSIATSLSSAAGPAQKGGQQIGTGLAGGVRTSLEQLMPSALTRGFTGAPAVGAAAGKALAGGVTAGAQAGLGQTNVFRPLAQQGTETARTLAQEYTRTGKQLLTAGNGLRYWVDEQGRARTATGQFVSALERAKAGIGGVKRDLAKTTQELRGTGEAAVVAGRGFGGLAKALAGLGAGAAALGFLRSSIQEAAALETVTRKLANTLGQEGAAGALDFTRKLSNDLGLSFKTLSSTFASFTAAATAANVPMEQQKDLFAAVAKTGQVLGLSNDELSGSLLALQQVASKGTVQMEELRGQLGERMPIAFAATAKGLGLTTAELIKLVESGKLTAAEFFPALTKGLNELTGGSSGTRTATQGFQDLQNAWDNLQTSVGNNLLPTVTATVNGLTMVISGATGGTKTLIQTFAGLAATVVVWKGLATATWLFANAQKGAAIASAVLQGILNPASLVKVGAGLAAGALVAWKLGEAMDNAAKASEKYVTAQDAVKQATNASNAAAQVALQQAEKFKKAQQDSIALASAQLEAYKAISESQGQSQVAALERQLQAGNALLNLTRTLSELEASRFSLASSVLAAQLEEAQARGATEGTINQIKAQAARVDAQAAVARLEGLQRAQVLEAKILEITQKRQILEANIAINSAKVELLEKENALQRASLGNDEKAKEIAQANYQVALDKLTVAQQNLGLIKQLQPLERQIAEAGREKAANEAQAAAYTATFKANLAAAVKPGGELASTAGRTAVKFSELGVGTQQLIKGLSSSNGILGELSRRMLTVSQGSSIAAASAKEIGLYGRGSVNSYAGIGSSLDQAGTSAKAFAGSGIDDATAAAASGAAVLNQNMNQAVSGAMAFYNALSAASGLPGARWAGGGVEAGSKYRINDGPGLRSLGQESFLSAAGRLSLINRPANSLWTAPSDGVVIPAATTAKLQSQGLLPGGNGSSRGARTVAPRGRADASQSRLEAAINTLTAAVTYLAGKDWSVRVPDTSGGRRRQLLHMISQLS